MADEILIIGRRNIVADRQFSELLSLAILRYQNRTLDAAQVFAELVALAPPMKVEGSRGERLGRSDDELVFNDAICTNESAVMKLGDESLNKIVHQLVEKVRRDTKPD